MPNPKPQLFLIHFAGGNSYSFQFLEPFLSDFEVIAIELPGRGRRINEKLLQNFDLAAADVYEQIIKKVSSTEIIIYGHSMGAYLALRVCAMLEEKGRFPAYLIVSGNAGPGTEKNKNIHLLKADELVETIERLGGVPPGFFNEKELFEFFEPILRADFEIAERIGIEQESAVKAPIYALMGSEEEQNNMINNWGAFTASRFDFEILEGNHFFIHNHSAKIARIIKGCYAKHVIFSNDKV